MRWGLDLLAYGGGKSEGYTVLGKIGRARKSVTTIADTFSCLHTISREAWGSSYNARHHG
jgi:hypothetical protein